MGKFAGPEEPAEKAPARGKKFAGPEAPAKPPAKRDYTWGEALTTGAGNIKQGVADAVEGASNLAYDAITDPGGTWGRVGKAAGSMVPAMVTTGIAMSPMAKAMPEAAQKALKNLSPNVADLVMQYYAGYLDGPELRRRVAEHPIATAADIATVGTLPGIAQAGAAAGRAVAARVPTAVTRAAQAARYVAVPTHAINDATNAMATRAIPAAARKVETVTRPVNAMMNRVAEGRGQQIAQSLRTAAPIVPNSVPTTAQAATPAAAPGFAAVAKAAEKRNPAQALANTTAQNQARIEHLGTIGYPDWNLRTQVMNRDLRSSRDYAIAGAITSPPDQAFFDLMQRPSMQEAYRVASTIARERNHPFPSGNIAINNQAAHNVPPTSPSMGGTVPQPGNAAPSLGGAANPYVLGLSGNDIHLIKQVLDDLAFDGNLASRYGVGRASVNAIRQTRGEFLNWAENHNPAYRHARTQHRDLSIPIDQTIVRQELQRSLQNPELGDATIHQRGAAFANATRDAATSNPTLRRATGTPRYDNLDDLFTPQQMGVVGDINQDFARAGLAEQQAAIGAPQFGGALDTIASDALGVDLTGPYGWMARPLVSGANRRLGEQVTNAMMTPEGAAQLMQTALDREAAIRRYNMGYNGVRNFITYGNPARWANRYPGLYNAMNAQQQQNPQPR